MRVFWLLLIFSDILSHGVWAQDPAPTPAPTERVFQKDSAFIFTTEIYLQAIKDDTLRKYFFEQKVKKAISAAFLFPPADSANKAWQPIAEAVTHDGEPLATVITQARTSPASWKQYRKKRAKWAKKEQKKQKKGSKKFARKFRKGKTEFNWDRLADAEAEYEEEQQRREAEKAERKRVKKEKKQAKKDAKAARKQEKKDRKNKVEEEEEERPFWLQDSEEEEEKEETSEEEKKKDGDDG